MIFEMKTTFLLSYLHFFLKISLMAAPSAWAIKASLFWSLMDVRYVHGFGQVAYANANYTT